MDPSSLKLVFQYLSFEKRNQIAPVNSVFRNLNSDSPYHFKSFLISDGAPINRVVINLKYSWSVQEHPNGSLVTIDTEGGDIIKQDKVVHLSKNELVRKLVNFYLNRSGTTVEMLSILNHPHGLESCGPLKVNNLLWKLSINSSRYDYTTWFNCLRKYPIEKVEIDLNGDDNMVLCEPAILSASEVIIKTRVSLPIQAIFSFQASKLKLDQELSSDDLMKLFEQWVQHKKPIGSKFTMKVINQDFKSIEESFKKKYAATMRNSDKRQCMLIETCDVNLKIFETDDKEVIMEVVL